MIWHIIALALVSILGMFLIMVALVAWATVIVGSALEESWCAPDAPAGREP